MYKVRLLGELAQFLNGGTPSRDIDRFYQGSIPWITSADLKEGIEEVTKARFHITEEAIESSATRIVPKGNLLFVSRTGVGKVAIAGMDVCISQDFTGIIPKTDLIDTRYLFRFLQSKQAYFVNYQRGATIKGVTRRVIEELPIPLPPLPEQRRIAAVLDAADALRAKRRAALAKLDALLQSVFLEMFGDPVRNEKGWEVVTVSDVAAKEKYSIKAGPFGSSLRKEYYVPVGYKIYGQEQVIRDDLTYGDYYIDQARYDSLKANRIKAGDILISLVGTFGKVSVVPEDFEPGIINPRLMKITLDRHKMHPLFFKQLLSMPSILNRITDDSHGGTMGIVNVGIMKDVPIPAPPIDIQERYVEILDRINEIKAQFSLNHERFMTLFESLQQRAFRGELSSIERNK